MAKSATGEQETPALPPRTFLSPLKISFVEVPGWLALMLFLLAAALVVGLIFCPTANNRIFAAVHQARAVFQDKDGKNNEFSRTFVFWVPRINNAGEPYPPQKAEELEAWLVAAFGGWTKWDVEGADNTSKQFSGWFYQASLSKQADDAATSSQRTADIASKIRALFKDALPYIIEQPHYVGQ